MKTIILITIQESFFVKHMVLIFSLIRKVFLSSLLSDFWVGILNPKNPKHLNDFGIFAFQMRKKK